LKDTGSNVRPKENTAGKLLLDMIGSPIQEDRRIVSIRKDSSPSFSRVRDRNLLECNDLSPVSKFQEPVVEPTGKNLAEKKQVDNIFKIEVSAIAEKKQNISESDSSNSSSLSSTSILTENLIVSDRSKMKQKSIVSVKNMKYSIAQLRPISKRSNQHSEESEEEK